eukprot:TRINITY_DN156896_c0_g1_i1.p1 TRINITY_DN156896_c0_g1~~TRINITY_DN156896_c0_g1_i1.p1  ORF type:complete len:107 (+),score=1.34 TRINITY_DN156896_c0_g1_i1:28-348(+)
MICSPSNKENRHTIIWAKCRFACKFWSSAFIENLVIVIMHLNNMASTFPSSFHFASLLCVVATLFVALKGEFFPELLYFEFGKKRRDRYFKCGGLCTCASCVRASL